MSVLGNPQRPGSFQPFPTSIMWGYSAQTGKWGEGQRQKGRRHLPAKSAPFCGESNSSPRRPAPQTSAFVSCSLLSNLAVEKFGEVFLTSHIATPNKVRVLCKRGSDNEHFLSYCNSRNVPRAGFSWRDTVSQYPTLALGGGPFCCQHLRAWKEYSGSWRFPKWLVDELGKFKKLLASSQPQPIWEDSNCHIRSDSHFAVDLAGCNLAVAG